MASVQLSGIGKHYGQVEAVRDVDFKIENGEFMVLVGPSGCGKSTTLRMIAGLEDITTGDLFIGDRRVNDVHPKDRDIAMVFQSYALYPHMTVYENMAFGLRLRGFDKDDVDRRVREAAKTLGIDEYLARKPKALSGGQRQRVAMGRAIVRNPSVFLFDEPLSNLDAKFRVLMRVELKRLQRTLGTTTVYVTHDQTEAMTLADRIAVMSMGRVRQVGTPKEVFDRPADRWVGGFIGSPAMNFLDGTVMSVDGRTIIKTDVMTVAPEAEHAKILSNMINSIVTVGFRPGDISLTTESGPNVFEGRADVVEHLGAEKYVYVSRPDGSISIRLGPDEPIGEGDNGRFAIRTDRLHVFGPDERNILLTGDK